MALPGMVLPGVELTGVVLTGMVLPGMVLTRFRCLMALTARQTMRLPPGVQGLKHRQRTQGQRRRRQVIAGWRAQPGCQRMAADPPTDRVLASWFPDLILISVIKPGTHLPRRGRRRSWPDARGCRNCRCRLARCPHGGHVSHSRSGQNLRASRRLQHQVRPRRPRSGSGCSVHGRPCVWRTSRIRRAPGCVIHSSRRQARPNLPSSRTSWPRNPQPRPAPRSPGSPPRITREGRLPRPP